MSEDSLAEREKTRYAVLKAIFDSTEGAGLNPSNTTLTLDELAQRTGLYSQIVDNALSYLVREGLTDHGDFKLEFGEDTPHRITHKGVKEIEASLKYPAQRTRHFSPVTIQNINYGNVGVQTLGNQNSVSFTQNINPNLAEVANLIAQLRLDISALPASEQQEALEYIEDIEAEAAKEQPRLSKMRAAGIAISNLLRTANQTTGNLAEFLGRFGINLPQL